MSAIELTAKKGDVTFPIHGEADPKFAAVVEAFATNFREDDEVGSAASVMLDGKTVVDVWGGYQDRAMSKPWERDTIVCMMSVAKGISAITFHTLVDEGLVDLDAPVAAYWPEFAQGGKEKLPVRYLLDHRAGLCIVTEKLPRGSMYDHALVTAALARQTPLWEPGTQAGYHIQTMGYMLSELCRRILGKPISQVFQERIAKPLGVDYHIGCMDAATQARCATFVTQKVMFQAPPDRMVSHAWDQWPDGDPADILNSKEWRSAEIPSGNGHGNARAVARVYEMVARGGELDGKRILSEKAVDRMITEQHNFTELMNNRPYHQALGLILNTEGALFLGPNPKAFGHHGVGGSVGMGDKQAGLSFSYSANKMHTAYDNGPRSRRLVEAMYKCL